MKRLSMALSAPVLLSTIALSTMLLTGCAPGNTPQAICERRADDDPAVRQLVFLSGTNTWLQAEHQDDLRMARKAAVNHCLQDMGVARPGGGVEQQRLPK